MVEMEQENVYTSFCFFSRVVKEIGGAEIKFLGLLR